MPKEKVHVGGEGGNRHSSSGGSSSSGSHDGRTVPRRVVVLWLMAFLSGIGVWLSWNVYNEVEKEINKVGGVGKGAWRKALTLVTLILSCIICAASLIAALTKRGKITTHNFSYAFFVSLLIIYLIMTLINNSTYLIVYGIRNSKNPGQTDGKLLNLAPMFETSTFYFVSIAPIAYSIMMGVCAWSCLPTGTKQHLTKAAGHVKKAAVSTYRSKS